MSTTSIESSDASGIEQISNLIEKHKTLAIFLGIELCFIVGGLIAGTVEITVKEGGPVLSHIIAGLLGGLAVVWILIGAVTYAVLLASNLYMRYQREM
ncbi:hypothetical protein [Haloprofundus salilacus]|uniref:hypothetical protein n=1 Tax=Haloprofundus salilacus TaxID=2876190 RepID=UPI001CC9F1FC|nr:hypothetical protein [Haloprofundus salilacus]